MGDWGGSPIRLYPAFLRAQDDPTGTTTWSALGSSKHHSPRKTLFYLAIKVNYVLHPQPCPSWHIQPWQLGLSPRLRGMVPLPPVSFWKDGEGMGMFLCRDLGPGPVHLCIGKTEPWKTRAEEHRLQTVGEGRVLGTCSGSNGCCRGRAHHGAQLTLHIPNHLCLSMALQGLMPLLGKAQGRGQQLLAGVQPASGGAPQTSPRSAPCYPRGASGLVPCPGAQLSPTPQPLSEHGTRLDGAHGVEMPVPVSTAWRSAAAGSPARLFQQHGRALAGSLAAPGARAGAAGAAPLPLPSPASGSTGPTPASPWRGCFPTAGSVLRTPSCL